MPRSGSFTLCPFELQRKDGPGLLTLSIQVPPGSTTKPRAVVLAADGSVHERTQIDGLALGPATILVGWDFTPWEELVLRADIVEGATSVSASAIAAPALRVLLPDSATQDCWATLLVQAGSTGFRVNLQCRLEALVHVPSGEEIVVLATSGFGEVRRAKLAPLRSGVVEIDLRTPGSLVRLGAPAPAEAR